MDVHITNLRKVEEKKSKELAEKYVRSTRAFESKSKNVSTEVDVRGQNLEEAWMNVEKFHVVGHRSSKVIFIGVREFRLLVLFTVKVRAFCVKVCRDI